jgi:hypothetical protein
MDLSDYVYDLCENWEEDKFEELTAFLEDHPEVDLELFRDANGATALHLAAARGDLGCVRVLVGHGADLEARTNQGDTPIILASDRGHSECLKVLIEAGADVHASGNDGTQAIHFASFYRTTGCLKLLINERADVNARTTAGYTPLMQACAEERLTCVQLLLDANADITVLSNTGFDALYWAFDMPPNITAHRVPGMPFSMLSCNTNATDIVIDDDVTQDMVDAHIAEYKLVHDFIDEHHNVLTHALSRDVQVDTRFGLGEHGIYQEPLERVLEYMGMSMNIDQVVNRSIDGDSKRRALIPGNVLEANHWHEEYCYRVRVMVTRQARRADGGY